MAAKVTFDAINKIIQVTIAPVGGVVTLDVKIDIYSDGKEDWLASSVLSKRKFPVRAVGGDALPGSKTLGSTFFLLYGWKIRPYESSHTLYINGNLYSEDGSSPYTSTVGTFNIAIVSSVSSLVDSTIQQLPEIEYASFQNQVTIDVINGVAGVVYPIGTTAHPVNNVPDAVTIANSRGFKTLKILSSATLDNGSNIDNFTISGVSKVATHIIISAAASAVNLTIENCNVSGTLDGGTIIRDCRVGELIFFNGQIQNSGLYGTLTLGGGLKAVFSDCMTVDQDFPPIVDMGGTGQSLSMPNYSGIITIKNLSSATEEVGIGLNAGLVILDPTITAGGFVIAGNGLLLDNSTSVTWINTDGLMNKNTISLAIRNEISAEIEHASFNGRVTIDVVSGTAGTVYPTGTPRQPVNNLADAKSIATTRGFDTLDISGDITIGATDNIDGYHITGAGEVFTTVTVVAGASTDHTGFDEVSLQGALNGKTEIHDVHITANGVTGLHGECHNVVFFGNISLVSGQEVFLGDCQSGIAGATYPIINIGGVSNNVSIRNYSGGLGIAGLTSGNISIDFNSGHLALDVTCTGGSVTIRGVGRITDKSAGTTIDSEGLISGHGIDRIMSAVESQRGHHTYAARAKWFYWNSIGGNNANDGLSPQRAKLTYNGVNGIDSLLTNFNHDVVNIIPDNEGALTTITETVNVTKAYTFLRGPGRDILFKPSTSGTPTLQASAPGVEFSGFRVETSGSLAFPDTDAAIVVSADFALIRQVWVEFAGKEGIKLQNSKYHEIDRVVVMNTGKDTLSSSAAVLISGVTQDTSFNVLKNVLIINNDGDGLRVEGVKAVNNFLYKGDAGSSIIHNGGWGVYTDSLSSGTHIIGPGVHIHDNTSGKVSLNGSGDMIENAEQWVTATAVWDELTAGHQTAGTTGKALSDAGASGNPWGSPVEGNTGAGTFGELVGKKLLTISKFLGLK